MGSMLFCVGTGIAKVCVRNPFDSQCGCIKLRGLFPDKKTNNVSEQVKDYETTEKESIYAD